jgi:hypothetical protein
VKGNDLKKLKCRVWDYGLFTSVSMALGPLNNGFGTVELYVPAGDTFPMPERRMIGYGLPGITRIHDFWDDLDSVDTFVFPDVGDCSEQRHLRSLGKAVFGTGGVVKGKCIADMEIDRELFKKTLVKRGLSVPKWDVVVGVDTLRERMIKEKDFWIKPNVGERGVFETFHHVDYKHSVAWLDRVAHDLGVVRNICRFMIEKGVPGVEPGSDFNVVNGEMCEVGLYGWENKGDSYSAVVRKLSEMPTCVKKVNDAMAPVYKEYNVTGAMSSEVRQGISKVPFFIDICSRFGNPPAGCITSAYENFPQVIHGVAHGEKVTPIFRNTHVAELSVEAANACTDAIPFEYKDSDWLDLKLKTACMVEDQFFHIPFPRNDSTIVKAVGMGNTQDEAEEACLEAAERFQCPGKSYNKNSFNELRECIKEGEKYGIGGLL